MPNERAKTPSNYMNNILCPSRSEKDGIVENVYLLVKGEDIRSLFGLRIE